VIYPSSGGPQPAESQPSGRFEAASKGKNPNRINGSMTEQEQGMQRGSDKHAPRVDDEMERETRSMTQGSPIESRAEESRLKEPLDDPELDATEE
jgi:hypothetical protein